MKKFKLFIGVFFSLAIAIFAISCNGDDIMDNGVSTEVENSSFVRESFFPTSENGTLKFDSESQFLLFLDYLDTNVANDSMLISSLQGSLDINRPFCRTVKPYSTADHIVHNEWQVWALHYW